MLKLQYVCFNSCGKYVSKTLRKKSICFVKGLPPNMRKTFCSFFTMISTKVPLVFRFLSFSDFVIAFLCSQWGLNSARWHFCLPCVHTQSCLLWDWLMAVQISLTAVSLNFPSKLGGLWQIWMVNLKLSESFLIFSSVVMLFITVL